MRQTEAIASACRIESRANYKYKKYKYSSYITNIHRKVFKTLFLWYNKRTYKKGAIIE